MHYYRVELPQHCKNFAAKLRNTLSRKTLVNYGRLGWPPAFWFRFSFSVSSFTFSFSVSSFDFSLAFFFVLNISSSFLRPSPNFLN